MPGFLERGRDIGAGDGDLNVVNGDYFFSLRGIVFGNGAVGLRVHLIEEVNQRSMRIFLCVEGGLDA